MTSSIGDSRNVHGDHLVMKIHQWIAYIIQRLNLTDEKEAILLEAAVSEGEYKVVIIDSLVDVMPGADENLVKDAVPVLKRLRMIAENTHACIIVLHHANWTGRTRGSTSIPGEVDVLINVKSSENTNHVEFYVEKTRTNKIIQIHGICQLE